MKLVFVPLLYQKTIKMDNTKKDSRMVYKNQKIEVNGTHVNFDGKYSKDSNTLKVYRMYGNVSLFDEAIQNFCIENNISNCINCS